jgi:hypothetical protein
MGFHLLSLAGYYPTQTLPASRGGTCTYSNNHLHEWSVQLVPLDACLLTAAYAPHSLITSNTIDLIDNGIPQTCQERKKNKLLFYLKRDVISGL